MVIVLMLGNSHGRIKAHRHPKRVGLSSPIPAVHFFFCTSRIAGNDLNIENPTFCRFQTVNPILTGLVWSGKSTPEKGLVGKILTGNQSYFPMKYGVFL